jgi:hypothetical protein
MFADLIAASGLWFLIAAVLLGVTVFVEQAGAARSPEEEGERKHGAMGVVLGILALLTPGLLLAHAFLTTHEASDIIRIAALAAPIAAVLLGALLGAIFGAMAASAGAAMRKAAPILALAGFAVTMFATLPSIRVLLDAAQNGGVIVVAP